MFIIVLVLVLVVACIVLAVIYANHNMKVQWEHATNNDVRLVREAAEHSQHASNLKNPVLALMEATNARRSIEVLIKRHGVERANNLTKQDVSLLLDTFTTQQDKIMRDLVRRHPNMIPQGDIRAYEGYTKERKDAREEDTTYHPFVDYGASRGSDYGASRGNDQGDAYA